MIICISYEKTDWIRDVMIDKEEIAVKMQLPIHEFEEITVSKNDSCVSDSHIKYIVQKVPELLSLQGIPCCHCSKTCYILSPLSACKDILNQYTLNVLPLRKRCLPVQVLHTSWGSLTERSLAWQLALHWKGGIDMANRNIQGFPIPEEDSRFHDTYQFLRKYRDAT